MKAYFRVVRFSCLFLVGGCVFITREDDKDSRSEEPDADCGIAGDTETVQGLIDFIPLHACTFQMGSPDEEIGRGGDEAQHEVTLTHDFSIAAFEVTRVQFAEVTGYNSYSEDICDNCPVVWETWHEAAAFANALSEKDGREKCYVCAGAEKAVQCAARGATEDFYECGGYRLPTEAEWEYAARAGTETAYYNGGNLLTGEGNPKSCDSDIALDNGTFVDDIAWYCGDSDNVTHPVGTLIPNPWGLYDMSGNVWEWTEDWYTEFLDVATDPTGPITGTEHTIRGGSMHYGASETRSASRSHTIKGADFGFRTVRTD